MEQYTVMYRSKKNDFKFDDDILCKCYDEDAAKLICKMFNERDKNNLYYVMYDKKGRW